MDYDRAYVLALEFYLRITYPFDLVHLLILCCFLDLGTTVLCRDLENLISFLGPLESYILIISQLSYVTKFRVDGSWITIVRTYVLELEFYFNGRAFTPSQNRLKRPISAS